MRSQANPRNVRNWFHELWQSSIQKYCMPCDGRQYAVRQLWSGVFRKWTKGDKKKTATHTTARTDDTQRVACAPASHALARTPSRRTRTRQWPASCCCTQRSVDAGRRFRRKRKKYHKNLLQHKPKTKRAAVKHRNVPGVVVHIPRQEEAQRCVAGDVADARTHKHGTQTNNA